MENKAKRKYVRGHYMNLTGQKFGLLTALRVAERSSKGIKWECRCECGTVRAFLGNNIRRGYTKSCGCLQRAIVSVTSRTHGYTCKGQKPPELIAYASAKARCNDPKRANYHYYGGRGIEFRFTSFDSFLAEVGPKPTPKHSIDRIDNNGHYEPGNVKWSTQKEQISNRRGYKLSKLQAPVCSRN